MLGYYFICRIIKVSRFWRPLIFAGMGWVNWTTDGQSPGVSACTEMGIWGCAENIKVLQGYQINHALDIAVALILMLSLLNWHVYLVTLIHFQHILNYHDYSLKCRKIWWALNCLPFSREWRNEVKNLHGFVKFQLKPIDKINGESLWYTTFNFQKARLIHEWPPPWSIALFPEHWPVTRVLIIYNLYWEDIWVSVIF